MIHHLAFFDGVLELSKKWIVKFTKKKKETTFWTAPALGNCPSFIYYFSPFYWITSSNLRILPLAGGCGFIFWDFQLKKDGSIHKKNFSKKT